MLPPTTMNTDLAWTNYDYVVVDYEGTGLQYKDQEEIVEIAAIKIKNGNLDNSYFHYILDPGVEIPTFISNIHGLTNDDVKGLPHFKDINNEFFSYIGNDILIAHNALVEKKMLTRQYLDYAPLFVLDTLRLSRRYFGNSSKHNLISLVDNLHLKYEIENRVSQKRKFHSAIYDAIACALVFKSITDLKYGENTPSLKQLLHDCELEKLSEQGTLF